MACPGRATSCQLYTSEARNGIKFFPYTYVPFRGLVSEDGALLQGTEGEATHRPGSIPAPATATPQVCCGQLGVG